MQCKEFVVYVRDSPRAIALCPTRSAGSVAAREGEAPPEVIVLSLCQDRTRADSTRRSFSSWDARTVHCSVQLSPSSVLRDFSIVDGDPVYGCIGVLYHEDDVFVALIAEYDFVCQVLPREPAYCLRRTVFLSLTTSRYDDWLFYSSAVGDYDEGVPGGSAAMGRHGPHPCAALNQYLANASFFFSPTYDLTRNLQSHFTDSSPFHSEYPYDPKYLWNKFMLKPLLRFRQSLEPVHRRFLDDTALLVPLIQGYVGSVPMPYVTEGYGHLCIISRSCSGRTGARYLTRGLDDMGNVANEVETEVMCLLNHTCYSFLILRGSVPVFWEQTGLQFSDHKIQLTRSYEATEPAFRLHAQELLQRYRRVHIVDLLKDRDTGSETMLSQEFRQHVLDTHLPELLPYTHFDFHAICKGSNFANVGVLIERISKDLAGYGYCSVDLKSFSVRKQQRGVVRVNCMDCLDRTNFAQNAICWAVLRQYLSDVLGSRVTDRLDIIYREHTQLWVENGDRLSRLYAGTGALRSNVLKSGKSTLAGLFQDVTKSVSRFYQNNFQDQSKQQVVDILLGKTAQSRKIEVYIKSFAEIQQLLATKKHQFLRSHRLKFFVTTFNVSGNCPRTPDVEKWLGASMENTLPDVYAIGLQEIVDLNVSQMVSTDSGRRIAWEKLVIRVLSRLTQRYNETMEEHQRVQYVTLTSEQLTSACLMLFIKKSLAPHVRAVETAMKKTGFGGLTGNKGAVVLRMQIYDTSVCFVTSHFAAGFGNYEERNNDYRTIRDGVCFNNGLTIEDHQYVFWLGDLNYRVGLDYEQTKAYVAQQRLQELLQADQLLTQKSLGTIFHGYYEAPITFNPTYKFDPGTNRYDTSEKRRTPSWTDRILIRCVSEDDHTGKPRFQVRRYDSCPLAVSDHIPVYAVTHLTIDEINRPLRLKIVKEIRKQLREEKDAAKVGILIDVVAPNPVKPAPNANKVKLYHRRPPPPPPTAKPKPKTTNMTRDSSPNPDLPAVQGTIDTATVNLPPPSSTAQQWWNDQVSLAPTALACDPKSYNPFRVSTFARARAQYQTDSTPADSVAGQSEPPDYMDDIFENCSDDDDNLDSWEPIKPIVEI
ncbi:Inositol-1,4,5-trisphosphate 5-phosphatase 1 [Dispira simplex]|nr:Inositol-1,4,5-trisphosphate 5-phosphatase 1 [Dispira simplex]